MPASTRITTTIAAAAAKRLADSGGRLILNDLIEEIASTTGEMRMLVRHAVRSAIKRGAIVRIRHVRELARDSVVAASTWRKTTGMTPKGIAHRSSMTERAILHAFANKDWPTVIGRIWEHHDRVPNRALQMHDTGRWTPMRWYDDRLHTGASFWHDGVQVQTVDVRLKSVNEDEARTRLEAQKNVDRREPAAPANPSGTPWPSENHGAELMRQMDGVLSLHRSGEGWIWFKPLVVRTITNGAATVSAVMWSHARQALGPVLAGQEAFPTRTGRHRDAEARTAS